MTARSNNENKASVIAALAFQEKCRLGQDRFASEQRGLQLFPLLDGPGVMLEARPEKAYAWPGIQQSDPLHHSPNPSMHRGLCAGSGRIPGTDPARSRARS
jgi:hypothetical protein